MDIQELESLLRDAESARAERKESTNDGEKIQQTICAFANDMPGSGLPGYIFVGVTDDGHQAGTKLNDPKTVDQQILALSQMRDNGNVQPLPSMTVQKIVLRHFPVIVVEVKPSLATPVRYKGQVWIRIGSRRGIATIEEERRLTERNQAAQLTFDRRPCFAATMNDIDVGIFKAEYLPNVIDPTTLAENNRPTEYQLASLGFFNLNAQKPTHAGVLTFGKKPLDFLPGAYIQFTRHNGTDRASTIIDHKDPNGPLIKQLLALDALLPMQIQRPMTEGVGLKHQEHPDYPLAALREFVLNAVLHRTYENTSAPIRIYWYADHVEILSPGGLYGQVTPNNYQVVSDYRNPTIAEVMKGLGYVERFGSGIARAQKALTENGNPPAQFAFDPTFVRVIVQTANKTQNLAAKGIPNPPDTPAVPRPNRPQTLPDNPDEEKDKE